MKGSQDQVPISILIRSFNSGETLGRVLEKLDRIEEDDLIVVDSGSTDHTLELAQEFGARILTPTGDFHYSTSLNLGFEAARCPWVLVLSSHCIPLRKDLLQQFRKVIEGASENLAVVYGMPILFEVPEEAEAFQVGNLQAWKDGTFKPGGNRLAMYQRNLWLRKPFSTEIPTAEDHEWFVWALENGFQAGRLPNARVLYRNRGGLLHMFRKGKLENMLVLRLHGKLDRPQRFVSYSKSFVRASLYFIKLLLQGKIDGGTCLRMIFFKAGAWYSYFPLRFSGVALV